MSIERKKIIRKDELSVRIKYLKEVLEKNYDLIRYLDEKGIMEKYIDALDVIKRLEEIDKVYIILLIQWIKNEIRHTNIYVLMRYLTLKQKQELEACLNNFLEMFREDV